MKHTLYCLIVLSGSSLGAATINVFDGTFNNGGLSHTIRIANRHTLFTINPLNTPIQSIDFSFELIYFPNAVDFYNGSASQSAIFQLGKVYLISTAVISDAPTRSTHSVSGLAATDFCEATVNANLLNCASNPIFTTTGTPIQLGYASLNGIPNAFN